MGEEQRQRAAYQTLEQLLEPEPRTLQQVWVVSQPLSGEEFEQVTIRGGANVHACQISLAKEPVPTSSES